MLNGTFSVPRVVEESFCRTCEDYYLSDIRDYRIHSNTLLPLVEFGYAEIFPRAIDESIFLNVGETKLYFEEYIHVQNFLTTRYIGRAPLEFYGPRTKLGRQFLLLCKDGNPTYPYRSFGTEDAFDKFNRNANEMIMLPSGGSSTRSVNNTNVHNAHTTHNNRGGQGHDSNRRT